MLGGSICEENDVTAIWTEQTLFGQEKDKCRRGSPAGKLNDVRQRFVLPCTRWDGLGKWGVGGHGDPMLERCVQARKCRHLTHDGDANLRMIGGSGDFHAAETAINGFRLAPWCHPPPPSTTAVFRFSA